jgi:hypothetical protein
MVGNYMFQPAYHSRLVYGIAGFLILLFLTISRIANRQFMAWLRRRGIGIRRVLLVGAGEVSRLIMRVLLAKPELGFNVVGFLDDNPEKGKKNLGPFSALGSIDNLTQVIDRYGVEEVIITLPWQYHRRIMSVLNQCTRLDVRARVVPDVLQLSLDQVDVEVLDGIPLLGVKPISISGSRLAIKRTLDVLITVVGMIVILPIMALVALADCGIQPRVVRERGPTLRLQLRRQLVHLTAGGAIDDARLPPVRFQEFDGLAQAVETGFDRQVQVLPVETGDEAIGRVETEHVLDVLLDARGGGGCQGQAHCAGIAPTHG